MAGGLEEEGFGSVSGGDGSGGKKGKAKKKK